MAYLTTDAFLNSPSNKSAREYLFNHADFVSLTVMPDNLMKDSANVEAPSHLLVVQKNSGKRDISEYEYLLINTVEQQNEFGSYHLNQYIHYYPQIICADEIKPGTNQYGKANQSVWANNLNEVQQKLKETLKADLQIHLNAERFKAIQVSTSIKSIPEKRNFTFLPVPESISVSSSLQLGLFDEAPVESINRASAYLNDADRSIINKETARLVSTIKTTAQPEHESIVLITARRNKPAVYVYKLCSNLAEIKVPANWMNADGLNNELLRLGNELKLFDYSYQYSGQSSLKAALNLNPDEPLKYTEALPFYKDGSLVIHQDVIGVLSNINTQNKTGDFVPLDQQKNLDFYHSYTILRDQYHQLDNNEKEQESDVLRKSLNETYDQFVSRYGQLNSPENSKLIKQDQGLGLQLLRALERKDGNLFVKSDVLLESLLATQEAFKTENPIDALARCLNDLGKVDLAFISSATETPDSQLQELLKGHIYFNPGNNEWETTDKYLSGNVVEKLKIAERSNEVNPGNSLIKESLEAIKAIQPEPIPFELLDFNLGERWIPLRYYERFATELFETNLSIDYFRSSDIFKVSPSTLNAKILKEYGIMPKNGKVMAGHRLLENALENTSPFFTYEIKNADGSTSRIPDNEATQLAHQKIETIRSGFVDWLGQLPKEEKSALERLYNDTFNCYVLRKYDGSHLTFPGLDLQGLGLKELYSSQKDGAWRIVQNRGALIDHEVGLGKTLLMVIAAMEMKRLGTAHKPMILALKANVDQIRDTFRKAYPNAHILAPGENDFTPEKRNRLFQEIKNNNWDCIILTHDQFGKIPQSPEIQQDIISEELRNTELDLETLKNLDGDVSRRMLRGLEIRKQNLSVSLQGIQKSIADKKDIDIDFRQMGIDHLFVDESHKFKNLTFTTRHDRVAGLGNQQGSHKALNMLFAVRELQKRFDADLCVTFLSGTPISNSLSEMYLIYKYLRPKELSRQNIENFDAWAAVFAKKTTDFEFSVTNQIVAKERFRHFIKVPELALFYNEICDYKTAKHIRLDKPVLDEQLINIKPTPAQSEFIANLMKFAQNGDGTLIGRSPLTKEEDKGRMLIATNYAKKMSADMRLINPYEYSDHPDNKVNTCARNVNDLYRESGNHKGTQIIFSDIGTPKSDSFNLYDALKDKLVQDFNIPAHEITFIHDWTDKKKPELFKKMNNGEIRILLGSTEKAGTGLNVQQRIIAMHHLDIPWKPSELEQRNGRGARQGNQLAKKEYGNTVKNFIYATEQSLDNYKFNLLKNKQTFISQMKNCELNVRTIDEGAMDEKSGMNFSEYIAILSGDTSLLEKSKLERKIASLESLKTTHFREIAHSRRDLEFYEQRKIKLTKTINELSTDETKYQQSLYQEKDGSKANPVQLNGLKSTDSEVIGAYIIDLYKNWKTMESNMHRMEKIGNLYGFDLFIQRNQVNGFLSDKPVFENSFFVSSSTSSIKYTQNNGIPNIDNPKIAARHFLNAIDKVSTLKSHHEKDLAQLEIDIPIVEKMIGKPFEKEDELKSLKSELSKLEREINIKIQEKQMSKNEAAIQTAQATDDDMQVYKPPVRLDHNKLVLLPDSNAGLRRRNRVSGVRV